MQILTIGEILWDVFETRESLGGAPLNFSATMQRLGSQVSLVTGVGDDIRGARALEIMSSLGLSTEFVQTLSGKDTGVALVTIDSAGSATYVIPRPAAFDLLVVDDALLSRIELLNPGWIYFGTLAQTEPANIALLEQIHSRIASIKGFYDMNLREGHWNLPLVQHLSSLATVLKLNDEEAEKLFALTSPSENFSLEVFCRHWSSTYNIKLICVTLGSKGCAIFSNDELETFPGYKVVVVDTVGAGDAFAAAFLHGLLQDWPIKQRASFANALGAIVASRPGAVPAWTLEECLELASH